MIVLSGTIQRGGLRGILLFLLGGIFALVAAGVAFALYFGAFAVSESGLRYRLLFKETHGLRVGEPVLLGEQRIGEVVSITPTEDQRYAVEVMVAEEHAGRVLAPPNSSARIVTDGPAANGTRRLQIVNRTASGIPMERGAVVDGLETWAEEQLYVGQQALAETWASVDSAGQVALEAARSKMEAVRQWAEGPGGRRLQEDVEQYRRSVEEFSRQSAADARKGAEELAAEAARLATQLREYGENDLARDLEESVGSLRQTVEEWWENQGDAGPAEAEP